MNLEITGVNSRNIEAYRTALKGLGVEQSVFALASKGATEEQIRQVLITDQAIANDVEAALAKAGLTTATKALTQAEMVEMATKTGISKATAEELLSKIGITATEQGQIPVKKQVTRAMLQQAVASGSLTKAEASQIATMLGLTVAEGGAVTVTNVLTASFTKLWGVITTHPIGAILTALGAIAVGTIAHIYKTTKNAEKAIVEAHKNAQQALDDTKSALSDDKSELQSINSELETTKSRLKELASIDSPTFVDRNELDKLSTANARLEAQQTLLENNIKLKQKSAALDAKELLGTQVEMNYSDILDGTSIKSKTESYTYEDHAKYQAGNLKNAYNHYFAALREGNTLKQSFAQEYIDSVSGDVSQLTSELLKIVDSFVYDDGTIIEGYEDLYNEYMGMIYNLQSLTNPDTFLNIAKSVTDGADFDYEKAISEAYQLAYEGNFDITKLNQDFVKALSNAGIDESTIKYIFSLKQQEYQLLVGKINDKYKISNIPDTVTMRQDSWDEHGNITSEYVTIDVDEETKKHSKEVNAINEALNNYAKENPVEFQLLYSYDENFVLLDKYIAEERHKFETNANYIGDYIHNAIQRVYDDASKTPPIIDETKFAISPEDAETLSEYQSKIDSISSSLADLHNLTSSDITSLMTEFKDNKDAMAIFEKFGVNGKAGVGDLKSALEEIGKLLMETAKDKVPQMSDAIEDMYSVIGNPKGDIQKLASELEELDDVLSRVRNGEAYSDVEVTNLINKYPELADAVQILTDGYSLEEDAIISLLNARITQSNEAVSYELEDAKAAVAAIQARIQARMAEQRLLQKTGKAAAYLDENGEVVYSGYTSNEEFQNDLKELAIAEGKLRQLEEAFQELYNTGNKDNTEIFDWYATYIERLQSDLDDLGTTIDDVYATWTDRNKALQGSIEKTEELVKAQTMAGAEYLSRANAVGLGQKWVDKIQSGEFKIDDLHSIDDADLIKDIQEYIKWYDQYLDMQEQADANQAKLNGQYAQSMEFMRSESEGNIARLEAEQQRIQGQIDLNGGKGTGEQYTELVQKERERQKLLEIRLRLEEEYLKKLDPNTEAYKEQEAAINDCKDGIADCEKNTKEWRIAILNLPLNEVADEIDNLNKKLDSVNKQIGGYDQMIAGAVAYIQDEIDAQEELKQGVQDQIDALQEANDERERALALEKAKYELERAMSQRTVKVYKGEGKGFVYEQDHEAVRDAQENLSNLEFEETIHALEKQIEYYDDIIEDLQEMQDAWNNIASNAQDLLDIQYALSILGEDGIFNTEKIENFSKIYQALLGTSDGIEDSIEDYEELSDTYDELIKAFEEGDISYEQCLADMSQATTDFQIKTGADVSTVMSMLASANNELDAIAADRTVENKAETAAQDVTATLREEVGKQEEILDGLVETIDTSFQTMCDSAKEKATTTFEELGITLTSMANDIASQIDSLISDATEKIEELKELKKEVKSSDEETGGFVHDSIVKVQAYHTGLEKGLVGEKQAGEGLKRVALRKLEPDEVPAVLKVNEAVLTQLQQQNVMSNIGAAYRAGVNTSVIKNNSSTPVVQNVTLTLPNVTNESGYNRLVQELQGLQLDALQFAKKR